MSLAAPDPATLSELEATLVEAIAANEQQVAAIEPTGPVADAHRAARAALEAALARLRDGTYGRCTRCDAPLPVERLELVPEAELCIPCAEAPRALYG